MSARTIAEYPYYAADGTLLATKRRLEPKDFRWVVRLPDGSEKFGLNGLKQSDLPLFRLPEMLASPLDTPVMIAEGEKDALTLAGLGYIATSMSEGAGTKNFPASKLEPLRYRRVYIFADNDDAGRAFRAALSEALLPVAGYVFHPELPDLGPKSDVTDWVNAGGTREQLDAMIDSAALVGGTEELEPPTVRPGAALADEVFRTIKRYVVLSDEAARACALWCLHTHVLEASEAFTPYLAIFSPSKGSGKTTLIDVLFHLAACPWRADSATAAAIYRKVDVGRGRGKQVGQPPTAFLDELDAVFTGGTKGEKSEVLRGVLNSGFKRDGVVCVCDGDNNEPRDYCTWSPKVLAGIGKHLPDTVADRSIPIAIEKATREELKNIEPARNRSLSKLKLLHDELVGWARHAIPRLQSREEPIAGLTARQDDIWGPLLNIADDCGGEWPRLAREAAAVLHADKGDSTDGRDAGTALLADLREMFYADEIERDFILSGFLAESLRTMDDRPWPEYTRGGPISTHAIARLLRAYNIGPRLGRSLGPDGKRQRGYHLDDCREAFRRYLPPRSGETVSEVFSPTKTGNSPSENPMNTLAQTARAESAPQPYPEVFTPELVTLSDGGYPADW